MLLLGHTIRFMKKLLLPKKSNPWRAPGGLLSLGVTSNALPPRPAASCSCARHGRPSARGFTLIEVLVAIAILSFGMLGMVGIQAFALQANRDARIQAQAAVFARELAEMMRGNKAIAVLTTATSNPYLGSFSSPLALATPNYCLRVANAATGCTSTTDIASAEMTDWLTRVDAALPGARVVVCYDSAPYDSNGLPQWDCTSPVGGSNDIAVIKIGWTRTNTDRSQTGSNALLSAADTGSRPYIILPVTSGNSL